MSVKSWNQFDQSPVMVSLLFTNNDLTKYITKIVQISLIEN